LIWQAYLYSWHAPDVIFCRPGGTCNYQLMSIVYAVIVQITVEIQIEGKNKVQVHIITGIACSC
jgi:hypothetical protein